MKIGITGGIGSGKTYVATFLKKKGFPVYSCDDRARILMKEDEEIKAEIIKLIGEVAVNWRLSVCIKGKLRSTYPSDAFDDAAHPAHPASG